MKDYSQIQRKPLEYYHGSSFYSSLKSSARERGISGFMPRTQYFFQRLSDHCIQAIACNFPFTGIRVRLQKMRGVRIGKHVHIGTGVKIDNVFPDYCIIEDGVSLAGSNYILTHNKPLPYHRNLTDAYVAPVIIKKNAWIGINVTILPGVTIGEGAIVAAGSVVNKDVSANTLWGGVPAKQLKEFQMKDGIPENFK